MDDTARPDPLIVRCRALWEAMERFDAAACRALGVGRSDLRALNLLEAGPLAAGEIGDRLGLTSGSVTALIDRLERAGLVSRRHPDEDRRRVLVRLEPATYAAFAAVYAPLGARVAAAAASLTEEQRSTATDALARITAAFDAQWGAMSGTVDEA